MKVLITGGAGYIGSHCNECFAGHGIDTVVADNMSDGHVEAVRHGALAEGDIGDKRFLDRLFKENAFSAVAHFAAYASVPDSVIDPSRYYRNNVSNMQTLLDACIAHGVKYFIFSSSAATFGEPQRCSPIDETHPQAPINPYGMTKLIGEKLLHDYAKAYGLRYCALRYFCAAGASKDAGIGEAHNPETHLIPAVLRSCRDKRPVRVFGSDYPTRDGSCIRDFVHVTDLAEAHYLSLMYLMNGNDSACFNLGSGSGATVLEVIAAAEKATGMKIPYILDARRAGDPSVLVASNKLAREKLGWNPAHSELAEMVADAWNWENHRKY